MAHRVEIDYVVQNAAGDALEAAIIQVNLRNNDGTSGADATVYNSPVGVGTLANPLITDATGRIEGWLDDGRYNLLVSGTGLAGYTQPFDAVSATSLLALQGLVFNVKSPDFGAKGDSTTDDTLAIQAAIDACELAGGGVVFLPPGGYKCTDTLSIPFGVPVDLLGAGRQVSILYFTTELGSGEHYVDLVGSLERIHHRFMDFGIQGPQLSTAHGVPPSNTNGLHCRENTTAERVGIAGCYGGFNVRGDHVHLFDCQASSNYYNLYFGGPDLPNRGDLVAIACDFAGSQFASMAMHPSGPVEGSIFIKTHFGFGPYCFYRESGAGAVNIWGGVTFIGCAFEIYGNAVYKDADGTSGAGIFDLKIIDSGSTVGAETAHADWGIGGAAEDYAWECANIRNSEFRGGGIVVAGPLGCFHTGEIAGIDWLMQKQGSNELGSCASSGRKLFTTASVGGMSSDTGQCIIHTDFATYRVVRIPNASSAPVAAGDLLQTNHGDDACKYGSAAGWGGGPQKPCGIAALPATVDYQAIPMAFSGQVIANCETSGISENYLKPSATNGKVAGTTNPQDAAGIVGESIYDPGSASTCQIRLRGLC